MTTKEKFLKDLEDFNFDIAIRCLPQKEFELFDYQSIKRELEDCVENEYWNSAKVYAHALSEGNASSYFIILSTYEFYIVNTEDDVLNFIDEMEVKYGIR